ncbi:hypothetical protein ACFL52_05425 [Candidatus Margulisiibacteriota bacterium]
MKKTIALCLIGFVICLATAANAITLSPKLSYVGWLGIGAEFSPLYKITKDIDLMGEVNWSMWSWSGGAGYMYGELNAVYNAQQFKMGEGKSAQKLNPYVGGGLILGFPLGTANLGGSFSGGVGFGIFGGVTGKLDPYTWYTQLKWATAPITYNWTVLGTGFSASSNALGMGMEFGIRMPL